MKIYLNLAILLLVSAMLVVGFAVFFKREYSVPPGLVDKTKDDFKKVFNEGTKDEITQKYFEAVSLYFPKIHVSKVLIYIILILSALYFLNFILLANKRIMLVNNSIAAVVYLIFILIQFLNIPNFTISDYFLKELDERFITALNAGNSADIISSYDTVMTILKFKTSVYSSGYIHLCLVFLVCGMILQVFNIKFLFRSLNKVSTSK